MTYHNSYQFNYYHPYHSNRYIPYYGHYTAHYPVQRLISITRYPSYYRSNWQPYPDIWNPESAVRRLRWHQGMADDAQRSRAHVNENLQLRRLGSEARLRNSTRRLFYETEVDNILRRY